MFKRSVRFLAWSSVTDLVRQQGVFLLYLFSRGYPSTRTRRMDLIEMAYRKRT